MVYLQVTGCFLCLLLFVHHQDVREEETVAAAGHANSQMCTSITD